MAGEGREEDGGWCEEGKLRGGVTVEGCGEESV